MNSLQPLHQPAELVDRHVDLARLDHLAHFFEVLRPLAGTTRVDEDPAAAVGRAAHAQRVAIRRPCDRVGLRLAKRNAFGENGGGVSK